MRYVAVAAVLAVVCATFASGVPASAQEPKPGNPFAGVFYIRASVLGQRDPVNHTQVAWRIVIIQIIYRGESDVFGCIGGSYENATVTPAGSGVDHKVNATESGAITIKSSASTVRDDRTPVDEKRPYNFTVSAKGATCALLVGNTYRKVTGNLTATFSYTFDFVHKDQVPIWQGCTNSGELTCNGGHGGKSKPGELQSKEHLADGPDPWLQRQGQR